MDTPWMAPAGAATLQEAQRPEAGGRPPSGDARRIAVPYPRREASPPHELASQDALARRLAGLLGLECVTDYDPSIRPAVGSVYYVPAATLVDGPETQALGVTGPRDLFGGVVPHAFVGTKAITHPLPGRARMPRGWSTQFGAQVRDAVLRGQTVFTLADARRAGAALLRQGPLRVKPVQGTGGRGQSLVRDRAALDVALEGLRAEDLAECGLVLEEHLEEVRTYSVGHVQVGGLAMSYVGTQELTRDNAGELVYGGSRLLCARGGFEALMALELGADERRAAELACRYDAAALACYPGLYASRRNYDVAQGRDAHGRPRMGVLEQSWRAGGASLAEACALQALQADPALRTVRAYARERYGPGAPDAPADPAALVYRGQDTEVGPISKYAGIASHGDG